MDSTRQCPPLAPGDSCQVLVIFPGIPSRPPGDYSDTLTLAGDNASVTVQLRGTVPPHTPGDEQYGNPLIGKLCAPAEIVMLPGMVGLVVSNCSDAAITISPLQRSNESSPFLLVHDVLGLITECPFEAGQSITLAPREVCGLSVVLPISTPPDDYSDDWTFPGDKASVTVHLSGTVPIGLTTFFVSAFNSPDLSPACAAGPVDPGIELAPGQEVVVTASGSATWFFPNNGPNGPDGDSSPDAAGAVGQYVPTGAIAALIGRVGPGNWMEIGSGPTTVTGPGELQFAFDDATLLCDNAGGFTVNVHFQAGP